MPKDPLNDELEALREIQQGMGNAPTDKELEAEFEALDKESQDALKELVGERRAAADDAPEKFTVSLGGKTFEADTQEALEAQIREWAGKPAGEAAKAGLTDAARTNLGAPKKADDKPPADEAKFELKKYAELFGEDPLKADEYAAQFSSVTRGQQERIDALQRDITAREQDAFLDFVDAAADFPSDDAATVQYLEGITRAAKLPITKRNLRQAWDYMKTQKLAVPKTVAAAPETEEPEAKPAAKAAAPPRAKGTGAAAPTGPVEASSAAVDKLVKLIENADDTEVLRAEMSKIGLDMPGSLSRIAGTGAIN